MKQLSFISKMKYLKVIFYFLLSFIVLFQSVCNFFCLSLETTLIYSLSLPWFRHHCLSCYSLNCNTYTERHTKCVAQCSLANIRHQHQDAESHQHRRSSLVLSLSHKPTGVTTILIANSMDYLLPILLWWPLNWTFCL